MIKCFEVPVLFSRSSEEESDENNNKNNAATNIKLGNDQIGTFIVMFYEKIIRKRTYAKTPN